MNDLIGKTVYFNVRTKKLVAVLEKDSREASIVTVKDGATSGRPRAVRASLFHEDYIASDQQPHANGYVPVSALPEGHPHAVKAPKTDWSNVDIDNLDKLTDSELAALILDQERIKKEAADLADRAKVLAKSRRGASLGLEVRDGIALVFSSGQKFDARTAARHLSPVDFQRILLPKADATLARKIFANEPDKLDACMVDNGPTLTVRKATGDDIAKYEASRKAPEADEDFSYTI